MPKLVPGIHALGREYARKAWMAGTSPAVMKEDALLCKVAFAFRGGYGFRPPRNLIEVRS
jgi:hypothetical protein